MSRLFRFIGLSLLSAGLLGMSACNEVDAELRVVPHEENQPHFRLRADEGAVDLIPGIYSVRLKLSDDPEKDSFLLFKAHNEKMFRVAFHLPDARTLYEAVEPIELTPQFVGQPAKVTIVREALDEQLDRIDVTFAHPNQGYPLAVLQLLHRRDANVQKEGFLRAYRKVKYSQRGVYIPIDGRLNSEVNNLLTNASAQVLLAPWVYARYNQVEWRLGSKLDQDGARSVARSVETSKNAREAWEKLLQSSPVVDYFPYLHGGKDTAEAKPLFELPRKRNQLRFVYTEGCNSRSALDFIRDFNAGYAAGHSKVSASPLFSFAIIRNWVLGQSALASIQEGFKEGRALGKFLYPAIKAAGFGRWSDADQMIEDSEPMFSWTKMLTLENTGIAKSALPVRDTEEAALIFESKVSSYQSAEKSGLPTGFHAPVDSGAGLVQ